MRPILRVSDVGAGSFRAAGPCSPEKETAHQLPTFRSFDGVGGDRVALAQLAQRWIVAEQRSVVQAHGLNGCRTSAGNHEISGFGVVGINANLLLQTFAQRGLSFAR